MGASWRIFWSTVQRIRVSLCEAWGNFWVLGVWNSRSLREVTVTEINYVVTVDLPARVDGKVVGGGGWWVE